MRAIILAGGLGTRISEETALKPKPMIEIGGFPIIWHIMKIYSAHNVNEFIPTLGYKGDVVKNFFINYNQISGSIKVDMSTGQIDFLDKAKEDWKIHLLETGRNTQTGGRIKKAIEYNGDETVLATYGDGLANVNISNLIKFHKAHGKLATLTAVRPPSRFGDIKLEDNRVIDFEEKHQTGGGLINGGFFVLEPEVKDYIPSYETPFERFPLESLSKEKQLMAYIHEDFWQPMDVARERDLLQKLWNSGKAPWKIW